ncbi:double-stranded RNA-binding Staufen -like protein [Labeo rohita]|uniref:Double-stranded RNA-binding Staufen-like protein n=1 Tax=Labeo rohita TaxID=84645 RepID=A0A498NGF8_LABRO|nr:double-stranded RNA-binding Staufen -like protein [Labeo rohita]
MFNSTSVRCFIVVFILKYHYPVPKVFYVQLTVGNNEFIGEGRTRQAARHNAAMNALQALKNEPIPERPPQLTVGNNEFIGEGRTRQAARHNAAMKALQALKNEPIPERPPQVTFTAVPPYRTHTAM